MKFLPALKERIRECLPSHIRWLPRYYLFYKNGLSHKSDGVCLDAGCGEAIVAHSLEEHNYQVVGVDKWHEVLEGAKRRYPELPLFCAELETLPFKNHAFNSIVALDVLEYVTDVKQVLGEFYRVLKPGGRLILTVTENYICSAKLFTVQKFLRRIVPSCIYSRDFPGGKGWFELKGEDFARKLGHQRTYTRDNIAAVSDGLFKMTFCRYYMKVCTALATDIVYGIRGLNCLRPFLFYAAVRIDEAAFKHVPGYGLYIELTKAG